MGLFDNMLTGTRFDSWLTNDNVQFQDNEKIDNRITELMMPGEKYDYRTFENFLEAIESATLEEAQTIEQALADPITNLEQFGRFIKCLIIDKMEDNARFQALDEENNG
jgi:DNA polymerase III epsilon subunit-like protein